MGGLTKFMGKMKGVVKGQLESVLMFVFMAAMWVIGAVSGYLKLIFSVLEHPFSELLDYQQDHLEKGVKEQVDESNSVKVLKKISSFLGNIENDSIKEEIVQQSGSNQVDKQVSIPIKSDTVSNQKKQESQIQSEQINTYNDSNKLENEGQTSTKKNRKSRRRSKKRGEKAHHLSAYNTPQPNEKNYVENDFNTDRILKIENEASVQLSDSIISSDKNLNLKLIPIEGQISEVETSQTQIFEAESLPESPMSADTPLSVEFDHAAQRDLFMTKYNYQQSSQNVENFPQQSVEQISHIPAYIPQFNHSDNAVVSDDCQSSVAKLQNQNVSQVSIVNVDTKPLELSRIQEEKSNNNSEKVKVDNKVVQNISPKMPSAQKSADFEMEELLSHIEVVRMKSQVDPEAIEWYQRNIQILSSIDIKSLVKKLHT